MSRSNKFFLGLGLLVVLAFGVVVWGGAHAYVSVFRAEQADMDAAVAARVNSVMGAVLRQQVITVGVICLVVLAVMYAVIRRLTRELEQAVAAEKADVLALNEELRREMAEREEAQKTTRALLNATRAAAYLVDAEATILACNDAAIPEGHEERELIGTAIWDQFPPLVAGDRKARFDEALRTRAQVRFEDEADDKVYGLAFSPIAGPTGRVAQVAVYVADITHRKHTEQSAQRLAALVESSQEAIVGMALDGMVSSWNPGATHLYGYRREEMLGRSVARLLPEDRQDEMEEILEGIRRGEEFEHYETQRVCKDGTVLDVSITCSPIRDDDGRVLGASSLAHDITARKRAEAALRDSEERLRVSKAETEAVNSELERAVARANEMAQEADRANAAKSDFLANMSHEIRTPLNGVIGMIGLLLDTELSSEQREYAEMVRVSGEALLSVINDILDFSKIEAGRLELEAIDFDVRVAIGEIMDVLSLKAAEKGLEFACLVHPNVPAHLRGDPGRLRQILLNLAGNAIKFTEDGEVVVRAVLEHETADSATVRFAVTDTGIGIPPDRLAALFEAFTQVDASTTRKYGGTGLGLTISKRLTEAMDGRIGVESEVGSGSTFWFSVPFVKQPPGREVAAADPEQLRGARVLIVDDNATAREVLRVPLEAWGAECLEARTGQQAIELLRNADPRVDLALIDGLLPDVGACALARNLADSPDMERPILVALSTTGQRGEAARAREAGFAGYLTKPVKPGQLRDCLATVMAGTQPGQDAAPFVTRHSLAEQARRSVRILLAEDNTVNQKVAMKMIEKLGHQVDCVANGREAVDALQSAPYDVVLMDCHMPEMDGYAATGAIRDWEGEERHTPIIAMTANAMKGDDKKCLDAGMDAYLAKPVRPHELADMLARYTERETPAHDVAAPVPATDAAVFDRDGLLERVDDDTELLDELVSLYLEEMPRHLDALRAALDAGDGDTAKRCAHTIKGSSDNMGAVAVRDVALAMETAAASGELAAIPGKLDKMDEMVEAFRQAWQATRRS